MVTAVYRLVLIHIEASQAELIILVGYHLVLRFKEYQYFFACLILIM